MLFAKSQLDQIKRYAKWLFGDFSWIYEKNFFSWKIKKIWLIFINLTDARWIATHSFRI